jgi:hypothetical protein
MAVGTTLAIIGVGMSIAGAVQNARGAKKAGDAANAAGESEAKRDEYNAGIADLQAQDALARGAVDESRFRTSVRGLIGSQRAGFAAQGVDVGSGSAADVQADAAYLGELDALQIRSNAAREAWGYRVEAADNRMAADVARKGGQAARTASRYQAAGTILGTGASLAMQRYGWDKKAA